MNRIFDRIEQDLVMGNCIVVLDDLPLTLEFIRYHFEIAGITEKIVLFESPSSLLESIKDGLAPIIIITDYQMPEMNGVELLQKVEELVGFTPGIITTADPRAVSMSLHRYPILEKGVPQFIGDLLFSMEQCTGGMVRAICPKSVA